MQNWINTITIENHKRTLMGLDEAMKVAEQNSKDDDDGWSYMVVFADSYTDQYAVAVADDKGYPMGYL